MCGISGSINFSHLNIQSIKNSLVHRGPNEQTHYSYNNVNLIHTRLSIQDITNGHQPFVFGNYVIIFNGEIYNHLELRKTHLQDFFFKTTSDTETLLYLYIKYKNNMFDLLDGMFAFSILDKKENKLILARDRAGKKPLYIYNKNNQILFASELNTIKENLESIEINEDEIYSYLRNGFFFETTTPYRSVLECQPGFVYEIDINTLDIKKEKYFELLDFYKKPSFDSFEQSLTKIDDILHHSIKNRLLSSDLEVGAFLSGGIDSSLIVSIASEYVKKLKTFTVKFEGSFNEAHLARLTAEKYKTDHHELNISMNLKNDVEKILQQYGEPFMDSSAIPNYYVSKEAKKHVTVILNGDGADELFGGYRRYVPIVNNWIKLAQYFSIFDSLLPNANFKQSKYNYFKRLLNMSNKYGLEFYNSAANDIFEDTYKFDYNNTFSNMDKFIYDVNKQNISELSKFLYLDFKLLLQNDLLKKMDIATMANSLEGRSPFLSKYMLEYAPTMKDQFKIKGTQTKYVLRELSKKYLPTQLINQPKRGFEVPLKNWVNNDLQENIFDTLSTNSYSSQFIDKRFIDNLLNNKINISEEKRAKILWTMYSLDIWKKNQKHDQNNEIKINIKKNLNKKNILFLTTGLGLGGAERVVLDICRNIDKNKFNISVIGLINQDILLNDFLKENIETKLLNHKKSISSLIRSFIYLNKYIKHNKIQLVHAHMFHTIVVSAFLKLFNWNLKIIFTPHNTYESSKLRQLIVWGLKPFRKIDTIFSKNMKKYFHKSNYKVIPNGIDTLKYTTTTTTTKDEFIFVIIGRLEVMKNHTFLLDVIKKLDDYNFKLQIIGSGLLEYELKEKVKYLNLENKVEFLGTKKNISEVLRNVNCFLLPSLWEAAPISLLEAAASGVPVISTPVGTVSEMLTNENGYLSTLEQFKNNMIHVMENYDEAKQKALNFQKLIQKEYNIKSIVKKYEELYEEVLCPKK